MIDEERCTGCGVCVEACGHRCLDILDGVAVLARPHTCSSEVHCIELCPEACIGMAWLPLNGGHCMRLKADYVAGRPGCALEKNSVFAAPVEERIRAKEEERKRKERDSQHDR